MAAMELIGAERPLEEIRTRVAALPSLWRRRAGPGSLEMLPGGIRLAVFTSPFLVRWATWLIALMVVLVADLPHVNTRFEPWLLIGTFFQVVALTFYVPVIRPWLLPKLRRYTEHPEQYDVLAAGLADLALAMAAVYLSGGWGSPYFHFALTALLIPTFFLSFRAVIVLGIAYMAAYLLGVSTTGEGLQGSWRDNNLNSFIGALVTPFLVALVPNYLGNLLRELDAARQDAVDALSDSDLQFRVARAFLEGGGERADVLEHVGAAALDDSRFHALVLLASDEQGDVVAYGMKLEPPPDAAALATAFSGAGARTVSPQALPSPLDAAFADCGWTASVSLRSGDAVEGWLVAGMRGRPDSIFHEVRLLDALAGQIALGMRNLRLTARVAELAAEGERIRIAREIHDGIAQMIYMLSLSLETAIDRVGSDAEEQRRRLKDLTALAKNALWEVRQYIFDLRPLLSGDAGLAGAVQGQVREFQAVSELPVDLRLSGDVTAMPVETSAALYRIVQEGLGNIFRHARASQVRIEMAFEADAVRLVIEDDGIGMPESAIGDGRIGYGMGNLRQRVEALRGTIDVRSGEGAGTRIEVRVPTGGDA